TFAGSPLTTTDAPLLATVMWSSPAVPLTITASGWPSPWPLPAGADRSTATCLTSVSVRSFTVMVSAPLRALSWMRSTPFRSRVMLPMPRVRRTRCPLAEHQRIGAGLAFDRVAAVARIPLEHVVAGAEEGDVVALVAVDEVFAIPAKETVGAAAAEQHVV